MGTSSKPIHSKKEIKMNKSRILLVLSVISLLSVTMAVSYSRSNVSQAASDFYQRHPTWTWTINNSNIGIPVTGISASPDYFQRHPELIARGPASIDLTDYYFRQQALKSTGKAVDLTDYYFRHPGQ
jgi:hypothetical protein